jgi:hypothetical protein
MIRRFIASLLILSLTGLGVAAPAQAAMVATDAAVVGTDRGHILSLLDRADVRTQLQAYGVDAAHVKMRVAAMTDEEAAQLAAQLDSLPTGGSIVGAIVLVFLVLLITDILGFTKIFPFTRSVR